MFHQNSCSRYYYFFIYFIYLIFCFEILTSGDKVKAQGKQDSCLLGVDQHNNNLRNCLKIMSASFSNVWNPHLPSVICWCNTRPPLKWWFQNLNWNPCFSGSIRVPETPQKISDLSDVFLVRSWLGPKFPFGRLVVISL